MVIRGTEWWCTSMEWRVKVACLRMVVWYECGCSDGVYEYFGIVVGMWTGHHCVGVGW